MTDIQTSLPPSYSDISADDTLQGVSQLSDLPPYSGRRVGPRRPTTQAIPKEFNYVLTHKENPVVVMTIIAEKAFSKHVPTFPERSPIKGRVKLTCPKPDTVQAVVVEVSYIISLSFRKLNEITQHAGIWSNSNWPELYRKFHFC